MWNCTRPRFRIAKPSAAGPTYRAATRSRPAATASSAIAGFAWSRCRAAEKFAFENEVFGGAIPKNFIPAIEKGIVETAEKGYLAGFPVVDFKVVVYDGSYHDVDSSEMSFKLAARKAFKAAMEAAKPALLEPIMNVEVQAPVEYAGDLMGDMNGRRGRISGMDTKGGTQIIRAQVPMSEMLNYQNDLTSMTQGRASFSMEFDHYDFVPRPAGRKDHRRGEGRQDRRRGRRRVTALPAYDWQPTTGSQRLGLTEMPDRVILPLTGRPHENCLAGTSRAGAAAGGPSFV